MYRCYVVKKTEIKKGLSYSNTGATPPGEKKEEKKGEFPVYTAPLELKPILFCLIYLRKISKV